VYSGTVEAGQGASLTAVQVNGTLNVTGSELTWRGGQLGSSGTLTINSGKTATLDSVALNGTTQIAREGTLRNQVSAPLTLGGGSKTYIGTATRPGGTLDLVGFHGGAQLKPEPVPVPAEFDITFAKQNDAWVPIRAQNKKS